MLLLSGLCNSQNIVRLPDHLEVVVHTHWCCPSLASVIRGLDEDIQIAVAIIAPGHKQAFAFRIDRKSAENGLAA